MRSKKLRGIVFTPWEFVMNDDVCWLFIASARSTSAPRSRPVFLDRVSLHLALPFSHRRAAHYISVNATRWKFDAVNRNRWRSHAIDYVYPGPGDLCHSNDDPLLSIYQRFPLNEAGFRKLPAYAGDDL